MESIKRRANVTHGALVGGTAPSEQQAANDGLTATAEHGEQLRDLGWNKDPLEVDVQLAEGVANDWVWLLLRRFDKEIFILREKTGDGDSELDLKLSEDAEFSANKLRTQLERFYMGVGKNIYRDYDLGLSQEGQEHSAWWTYFVSWYFDVLFTTLLSVLICMVLSTRVRRTLFPPMPLALVDRKTGEVSKPAAGVLGSTDTATGAPQIFRGEAMEKEAANFASNIAGIAVEMWTAKDQTNVPSNIESEKQSSNSLMQPHEPSTIIAMAQDKSSGVQNPDHDKTKRPMQAGMFAQMLPLLQFLHLTSDLWERIVNALDATHPFSRRGLRLRLVLILVPLWLASVLCSAHSIMKIVSFVIGVYTFTKPPINRMCEFFDGTSPGWRRNIRLDNTILRGMPTNCQIALTILRENERHRAPIPPAPSINQTPPMHPVRLPSDVVETNTNDMALGATEGELLAAADADEDVLDKAGGRCSQVEADRGTKPHRMRNLLGHVRRGIKTTVEVAQKADRLRAKAGRQSAKNRVGVLDDRSNPGRMGRGPSTFRARSEAKEGQVVIGTDGTVSFEDVWNVRVSDITELRKQTGLGLKTKLIVSWAMDLDIKDGLEIRDRAGNAYVLTAVTHRDQLFDRLCALGGQKWDVL